MSIPHPQSVNVILLFQYSLEERNVAIRSEYVSFCFTWRTRRRLEFVLNVPLVDLAHVRFVEQAETEEPFQFCLRQVPRMDHMTPREDGLTQLLDLFESFRVLCRQLERFEIPL